jgi:hypothetical protein
MIVGSQDHALGFSLICSNVGVKISAEWRGAEPTYGLGVVLGLCKPKLTLSTATWVWLRSIVVVNDCLHDMSRKQTNKQTNTAAIDLVDIRITAVPPRLLSEMGTHQTLQTVLN